MSDTALWRAAISTLHKVEGGLSMDERDPGNWTGGAIGKGELRGTKWGISAQTYPTIDIHNLTQAHAAELTRRDFWDRIPRDLPDDTRWFAFDVAFHHGPQRATAWLADNPTFEQLISKRIEFISSLRQFPEFGRGWMRRVGIVVADIGAYKRQNGDDGRVSTIVLHDMRLLERLSALAVNPVIVRGAFVWRARDGKLDLRKE
jgi:lysozyme family protein